MVKGLEFAGAVYYPGFFMTTAMIAATVTMVPLGLVRGGCNAAEYALVPNVGLAAAHTWNAAAASSAGVTEALGVEEQAQAFRETLKSQLQSKSLLSDVVQTRGVLGAPLRLLVGAFLPSTDVVIDKLVASTRQAGASDSAILVAAAADGVVAGHIATLRDNATTIALVVLGLSIVAVGVADQSSGRAAAKAEEAKQAAQERLQQARDAVGNLGDAVGNLGGRAEETLSVGTNPEPDTQHLK